MILTVLNGSATNPCPPNSIDANLTVLFTHANCQLQKSTLTYVLTYGLSSSSCKHRLHAHIHRQKKTFVSSSRSLFFLPHLSSLKSLNVDFLRDRAGKALAPSVHIKSSTREDVQLKVVVNLQFVPLCSWKDANLPTSTTTTCWRIKIIPLTRMCWRSSVCSTLGVTGLPKR